MKGKLSGNLRTAMNKAKKQAIEEHSSKVGYQVSVDVIVYRESQPRRYFDPEAMQELVSSVKQHGILQPLLVRPRENGVFELVAGERRYRAAKEAELQTVPVTVREMTDVEATQFALLENLQREDLNPVEETEGVLQLLAVQLNKDVEGAVSILHKMQNALRGKVTHNVMGNEGQVVIEAFKKLGTMTWESFVKNRLPLRSLPDDILAAIRQGQLAYTKAVLLARIDDPDQRTALLDEVITSPLSVAQLRERVKALQSKPESPLHDLPKRASNIARQFRKGKLDEGKRKRAEQLLGDLEALLIEG